MTRYLTSAVAVAAFDLADAFSVVTEFPAAGSSQQPYKDFHVMLTFDEAATTDGSKSITVTQAGGISRSIQCTSSLLFDSTTALLWLPEATGTEELVRFLLI
jgi:hypothetical protein